MAVRRGCRLRCRLPRRNRKSRKHSPICGGNVKALPLLVLVVAVLSAQTTPNWTRQIPQNFPTPRSSAAMAYDSAHGQVVLFGGQDASGDLNDTWVWDGTNWTKEFPMTSPPGRVLHNMAYDALHGQVVLFGGIVNGENPYPLNDTWVWDGVNWTQEFPQTSPQVRSDYGMAYDSVHMQVVIF